MAIFEFDEGSQQAEYYELLNVLMERWETEIVEFKEAKGNYSEDKIGQYFSAISNEANLKNQQYGWFVLGVSEQTNKHPVGTSFKDGDASLLEKFKYEISKSITDGMSFLDIIELMPIYGGKKCRVLMFKIPAAVAGMPTEWKTRYYARSGDSLIPLQQYKIDIIRNQERKDWSRQILAEATIDDLDSKAIAFARTKYKEKMNRPHINEEIDSLSNFDFLSKIKLIIDGKITNAAMVLLGREDRDILFERAPHMMWRLIDSNNDIKDYELFGIPFITVTDRVFSRIRNLTYRYMPNQQTLFPMETEQYDTWMLRELLNNCIAHSYYQSGERIYVNECEDSIVITNPGSFLPQSVEAVLQPTYNPPFYRNQLLADAMVKFHMIDTATSGIKKVYRIQKEKFFPLPDYNLSNANQVSVTIYGKILDEKYTQLLYRNNENLDLETVFLLDKVQKHTQISKEHATKLKKLGLIEGRYPNVYVSFKVASIVGKKAEYVHNKGLDENICRQLILEALKNGPTTQHELMEVLDVGVLPGHLNTEQKSKKLSNILQKMRKERLIKATGSRRYARWSLA